ncbi:SIR2 family NAD-dependent protein deacylase [Sinorhizobium meliloti]|uniref:SIR2 family NAD-dependent protein deacylase n=1 Tax=Rhizobium meliloti TaxID=382 RepID=UPI000FDB80E1|nr:SIR2 family protein [Sinorhizobium meliloti]RVL60999.1 SIR2 family protein [Sinorhizobium meliloti]
MSEYFEIAYAAAAKRLCLFTGTGFSKALTANAAPGWQELLETICDKHIGSSEFKDALFPPGGASALQLDEAAQVIAIELLKIGKNIHEEIASLIAGLALSGDYPEAKKFFQERSFRVVTTNYDKLAETLAGPDCPSLSPGRPIPRSTSRVKAYHVHGSIEVPGRMVVTADDYFGFMHSESYFSRKLSTVLHENTVVILGYSLGDVNLKYILSDYRGFVRNHVVSNSVFFVSRKPVDQRISDYYSNCYGIRVISNTEVEDFFRSVNSNFAAAEKCLEGSVNNIKKVLYEKHSFTEKYLQVESSFYEIVSSIGAVGASLDEDVVVRTFEDVIAKKMALTSQSGAWPQYVQLASWLTYLGSLVDVRKTAVENTFLKAVLFSMNHMSKSMKLGYSWHAYKVWDARWSSITADNRALIAGYILDNSAEADAIEVASRG